MLAHDTNKYLDECFRLAEIMDYPISTGKRGVLIGWLNQQLGEERRHELLRVLFGVESSKKMSDKDWFVLDRFVGLMRVGDYKLARKEFFSDVIKLLKGISFEFVD